MSSKKQSHHLPKITELLHLLKERVHLKFLKSQLKRPQKSTLLKLQSQNLLKNLLTKLLNQWKQQQNQQCRHPLAKRHSIQSLTSRMEWPRKKWHISKLHSTYSIQIKEDQLISMVSLHIFRTQSSYDFFGIRKQKWSYLPNDFRFRCWWKWKYRFWWMV